MSNNLYLFWSLLWLLAWRRRLCRRKSEISAKTHVVATFTHWGSNASLIRKRQVR